MSGAWRRRGPAKRSDTGGHQRRPIAGTITGIKAQVRAQSERVNVHVDGEYAFSLTAAEAVQLHVGEQLDACRVGDILDRDATERAYHRALQFLAARPRSAFEIRRRLRVAGVEDLPAGQAMDRLEREGLIDDAQFATFWVEQRQTFKPRGPRALRSELRAKGVAVEAFAPAIDLIADHQIDAACRAGVREARRHCARAEREFVQALGKYLVRRGFDYGIVRAATAELWLRVQAEGATRQKSPSPPAKQHPETGAESPPAGEFEHPSVE